ncbi:MAG: 3-deoxy-manno-octulosonate cytidylyltransferase [Candidatus Cloacimonadales bacterium]
MKLAVIPARYASTRLPGKPLQMLADLPMIIRVYRAVEETQLFDKIIIATDDQRIIESAKKYDAVAEMTAPEHQSGTDRVAEIARQYAAELIVNIQGDEPFITRSPLQDLLEAFTDESVEVASLMHRKLAGTNDPDTVKVVCDKANHALYFSRANIPFNRSQEITDCYEHIGVYAFRAELLQKFVSLPVAKLEAVEKLEQLRLLENGFKIKMVETDYRGFGIDTPQDLERAKELLAASR